MKKEMGRGGKKVFLFAGKRNDILRFYRSADYFVIPSLAEGLSNSLLEAMSCGLTAIESDSPSNREVIENGKDGFLFSFVNPEKLAKIIKSFLTVTSAARSTFSLLVKDKIKGKMGDRC
ncbi:MAG: glycosyltransferase family 4 protein [Elusimicrobia bacterium]|nr:glycosyltransferase family 4 protein [Elusimicrobiota bacterium]